MEFRFYEIWREAEYVSRLLEGILTSVWLTVLAAVLGFSLSIGLALLRRSRQHSVLSWCAAIYIELIRNTPLIVQLFFVAFVVIEVFGVELGKSDERVFVMRKMLEMFKREIRVKFLALLALRAIPGSSKSRA